MRPHHLLEEMESVKRVLGSNFSGYVDVDAWRAAERLLARSVTFDFTNYGPSEEHVEFGLDLLERGVFRLPFDCCFFTWRSNDRAQGVIAAADCMSNGKPHWTLVTVGTCVLEGESWETGSRIPFQICLLDKFDPMNSPAPIAPILTAGENRQRNGEPVTADVRLRRAGESMRFVCGAISMLMSKDVTLRIEAPPSKLNVQRERKGKPLIGEVRTIKVSASSEQSYIDAARKFGTHASPRMHWRRGHFRTLSRGQENQRIIPGRTIAHRWKWKRAAGA